MNGLAEFFRTLGPARLAAMATVAAITIGFIFFLSLRLSTPNMSLLFSGLDLSDSSKIVQSLEAQGIPYKLVGDGNTILVPDNQVSRIRISVAEQGLARGGSLGYELFDRSDSLGATSFVQNINHLRALEGELARTIQSIENVSSARIHLVMPQRRLFSNETRQATASIFIKTSSSRLSRNQIMAIQNLVSAAVPDLQPERISIVDQKGSLLARGSSEDTTSLLALSLEEKKISMENRLRGQIETLLEKTVGLGKVRAEVSAELDLNRITSNSETYDPDGQVILSESSKEIIKNNRENAEEKTVSVNNNLPDQDPDANQDPAIKNQSSDNTTETTTNFLNSKTIQTQIHEAGTIKKITVAVLVDGTYQDAGDGSQPVYQPRNDDDLTKLEDLVKSTIGFDEDRGDSVQIINMQFATVDYGEEAAEESLFDFSKADIMRFIELGGLMLIGILVIFFALRPLIKFLTSPPTTYVPQTAAIEGGAQGQLPPGEQQALAAPQPAQVALVDDQGRNLSSREIASQAGGMESAIDVAAVEGKIQATALKKVGELVERHPEESAAVVRGWLYG